MARLVAVCASKVRQEPKVELPEVTCVEGKGLEGDSHFGIPGRPLSLLRREDVEQAEVLAGFPFPPGSLAENLVVEGLPDLAVGDLLEIGGALLRVAEKGKRPDEPHSSSATKRHSSGPRCSVASPPCAIAISVAAARNPAW